MIGMKLRPTEANINWSAAAPENSGIIWQKSLGSRTVSVQKCSCGCWE